MKRYEYNYGKNPEGTLSTISGYATETTNFGETAFGILNKSTRDEENFTTPEVVSSSTATLFSVGNGTDHDSRKNIIELKADGTVYINGVGQYDGTNPGESTNIADEFQGIHDDITGLNEDVDRIDNTIESIHISEDNENLIYTLLVDGQERGTIHILRDQFLTNVSYNEETNNLEFTFIVRDENNEEVEKQVNVNMSDLQDIYSAGDGLDLENKQFSVKVDADTQPYIEVSANGVKLVGINEALDKKVSWDESKKVITLPADGSISALRNNGLEGGVLVCQRTYDEGATYVTEVGTTKNNLTLNSIERPKIDFADGTSENVAYESEVTDISSSLDNYLPLSGGTMSGSITFESALDNNGYEYIDLGLPSGNLWAKCNIGATNEEEAGLYFQWGDTQGYTAEQVGNGEGLKAFSWADYKFSIDGSSSNFSKYNASDSKTVLDPEDDAVHVNMGGNWRMPTFDEQKELCLNTDIYLVPNEGEEIQGTVQEQSGIVIINWASQAEGTLKGVKFYKKGDKQIYMFVPASGGAHEGSVQGVGQYGYLWSSSLYSSDVQYAWYFYFSADSGFGYYGGRCYGFPVRGVCPKPDSVGIVISGKSDTDLLNSAGGTTTLKTINNNSLLGSGNIELPTTESIQDITGSNTYTDANYISKETNLTDAVLQLDEEIKAANDNISLEHANAEATYAKKTDLENYLPLTGGTVTGNIVVGNLNNLYNRVSKSGVDLRDNLSDNPTGVLLTSNSDSTWQDFGTSKQGLNIYDGDKMTQYTNTGVYIGNKTSSDLLNAAGSTTPISDITTQVQAAIVDSAPETLDTLNELAAALGDDPNFATTVTNQIASKVDNSKWDNLMQSCILTNIQDFTYTDDHVSFNHQYRCPATGQFGDVTNNNKAINAATSTTAGVMTAADKSKLDSIEIQDGDIIASGFRINDGTASEVLTADGDSNTLKTINGQTLLGSGNITTPTPTVNAASGTKTIWTGTQSEYEGVTTKDANTLYFITEG